MTKVHRLPLALAALAAATPAIAHDASFLHSHVEGGIAVAALAIASVLGWKFLRSRARK